jgi:hypothetical protein
MTEQPKSPKNNALSDEELWKNIFYGFMSL